MDIIKKKTIKNREVLIVFNEYRKHFVRVDNLLCSECDYPILYDNGKIGWDHEPPKYLIRSGVVREFLKEAKKLNEEYFELELKLARK